MTAIHDIDALLTLLATCHADGGERVDQLAHALQCADLLAERVPDDEELHVAGLLHDIGHALAPDDDAGHGRIAGEAVEELLGERVARLIAYHVPAKRYLVTVDAEYRGRLSPVSVQTLARQGGTLSDAEVAACAALPDWDDGLTLRRADDDAKVVDKATSTLSDWRPVLERVAGLRHR